MSKSWKCPKCGREFAKIKQSHSCTVYPLERHFKGKEEIARPLYNKLVADVVNHIGPLKIESLPCCIHLVSNHTFAGIYALKNKIRIGFTLNRELKSHRIAKRTKMSTSRYLHSIDIEKVSEINKELISWLRQAYKA